MARPKKIKNDQEELINALLEKDILKAWEIVKFIGVREEPNVILRFLIFNKAAASFDPTKNNNFILYYKNFINFHKIQSNDSKQYLLTNNRSVINLLKLQACSPSDNVPEIVKELMEFS